MAQPRFEDLPLRDFTPAAVATMERTALWKARRGSRLLWLSFMKTTNAASATDSYLTVGTADEPEAFVKQGDLDLEEDRLTPLNRWHNGKGVLLEASGGHVFERDEWIYVYYQPHHIPGSTKPVVRFQATLCHSVAGGGG